MRLPERARLALVFAVVCGCSASVLAIYARQELENVPIDRLIANLEAQARRSPANVTAQLNLARVHAMAYAEKAQTSDATEVLRGWEVTGSVGLPSRPTVQPANDPKTLETAKIHLNTALEIYRNIVKAHPRDMVARLGYGWCLEETGKKAAAIATYRAIVKEAWPKDPETTAEAVRYLLLVGSTTDRSQLNDLYNRANDLAGRTRPITPIVVPLRDDVRESDLVDWSARVRFDADGSGLRKTWTWIGRDVGWLVYDRAGTRQITSALQLFGSVTFWLFWPNGYEALSALDDNHDGTLAGRELAGLAIWRDGNSDGVSDSGEVKPLSQWGIVKLSCDYEWDESEVAVAFSRQGVTFENGITRRTYDILLHQGRL